MGQHFGVVGEQVVIEDPHHCAAGAGGDYDVVVAGQGAEGAGGQASGLVGEPGVVEGLAAAGLVGGEVHRDSATPEGAHHADAHFGVELVDDAGDEK